MTYTRKWLLPVTFVFILIASSCTTTYYLVRHAEKACEDCQACSLTAEGSQRALALRDHLAQKGIDTIFASQCLRTQLTAQPLAAQLHKSLSIYQTSQLNTFISILKGFHDSRSILIVGHSDQVPAIIESMTNHKVSIAPTDFDKMFIITKKESL